MRLPTTAEQPFEHVLHTPREVFGTRGYFVSLRLEPQLVLSQFGGDARVLRAELGELARELVAFFDETAVHRLRVQRPFGERTELLVFFTKLGDVFVVVDPATEDRELCPQLLVLTLQHLRAFNGGGGIAVRTRAHRP